MGYSPDNYWFRLTVLIDLAPQNSYKVNSRFVTWGKGQPVKARIFTRIFVDASGLQWAQIKTSKHYLSICKTNKSAKCAATLILADPWR